MQATVEKEFEHGWCDKGGRFPFDQRLRRHGFIILSRPKRGKTLWSLEGVAYSEEEALHYCQWALKSVKT